MSETYGYTIDNLDTKHINEAEDNFEEIFIRVRNLFIERGNSDTLEDSDLDVCHQIARNLSQYFKKI